jgi:formimidoylglutamate deiminase
MPYIAEMKYFKFNSLLQKDNWLSPAYVGVDDLGLIQYLSTEPPTESVALEVVNGYALPGFQNAHSHAFQYAMVGMAERHPAGSSDDFWSWREAMYQCALTVDPDQAEAIAAILYGEMLRHGYTHVAEFHYLHHDKDGKPYNNLAEMGARMVSAAKTAGIKITLVPVFYQKGGFGLEPQPRQKRFISKTVGDYFKLFEASKEVVKNQEHAKLGFCAHSLRAVDLKDVVETFHQGPKDLPFHIHVAEQKKEVTDCLNHCGKRPMQWMLENLPLDDRFHLVHSTHLDDEELTKLAASKANVVLCPSTEGNLGDGIFRMREYVKLGGHWSIGTDSHIGINPMEEFRMIDYRQRLVSNFRNTFEGDAAGYLVNEEIASGRKAMGNNFNDHFVIGQPFDAIVYNSQSHLLADTSEKNRLATIVFTGDSSRNLGTIVNGKWVVKNQHHINGRKLKDDFAKAMKELMNR